MAAPEASGHFIAQRTFAPALGFSRSPVWLRITVHNPAPATSEVLLEVAYPHLDELELYSAGPAGKWTSQRTGDHFPFAQRPVPGRMFAFPLRLPPGDNVLYLRCRTTSTASFPLRLETPAGYAAREKRELNQIWFLFGMMVMLLVYNLFILLSVREMSILFLMLFIIDYLLFLLTHNGMSFQYIWPTHPAWNEVAMPFFIFLGSFFGCLFTGAFCRVLPTPSPAQRWITGETIALAIGSFVCPLFLSYRLAMPLAIGAISLFLVTLLLTGLSELMRGNRSARYLLLAIFLFTVGVALFVGKTLGVLPDTFLTTWSIQVAATLLVIFLSLSLSDRINLMKLEMERLNESMEQQLRTDSLTGLPNRFRLLEEVQRARHPALIILNIDAFREINDFYGDEVGDQVLREVANRLAPFAAAHGLALYRLQADEYALMSDRPLRAERGGELMARLISAVADHPLVVNGNDIPIGITIGCASADADAMALTHIRWKELATRADMALKRAKREHKHFLVFDESMQIRKEYENNLLWTRKLKESLLQGRIIPYFQPIYNNRTRRVEKYECLIRLRDTDNQVIPPMTFLGISKKSKLYPRLTRTMVEQCMEAFRDLPYEFSLNLSIEDILEEHTHQFILDRLLANPGLGKRMVFEIVESEGIANYALITDFIQRVKEFGCKIAIDDFGSGFSNFEYILKLAVDYIKIDASLIRPLDHDRNAQALTESIVVICRKLGLKTIAEFVHSPEVFAKVCEMGIDYSQGYYLGPPMERIPPPVTGPDAT